MKHGFLLVCLVLVYHVQSDAQFIKGFGLKGGPVSATQSWDYSFGHLPTESRWGIDLGVYLEAVEHPIFSILAEAHYVQKGFSTPPPDIADFPEGTGEPILHTYRLDYLSLPVLGKLRYDAGNFAPYIVGGPRIEFLLNTEGDVFEKANSIGLGISVGGGLEVPISNVLVLTEITYSPSFDDVYSTENLTVSNESIQFLLGLRL